MSDAHVLVLAKAPVPGRVKTRLCPPLTHEQAARVAGAALADTLEAVSRCGAGRRLLALDGEPGDWVPAGFEVFAQVGATFNDRLQHAWQFAGGPGLQIGMDTPQVTPDLLDECLDLLHGPGTDAVLGHAEDGGWWIIGARRPQPGMFEGVPMSAPNTGVEQARRLAALCWRVKQAPVLRDVDTVADLIAVRDVAPGSRFAAAVDACMSTGNVT